MKTRNEFGTLLNNMGLIGNAVEIGVDYGAFSDEVLKNWFGKLYFMVDAWVKYPGYNDYVERDDAKMEEIYQSVVRKSEHNSKVIILRSFSVQAARMFVKDYFDFVYIDADHTYKSAKEDIKA